MTTTAATCKGKGDNHSQTTSNHRDLGSTSQAGGHSVECSGFSHWCISWILRVTLYHLKIISESWACKFVTWPDSRAGTTVISKLWWLKGAKQGQPGSCDAPIIYFCQWFVTSLTGGFRRNIKLFQSKNSWLLCYLWNGRQLKLSVPDCWDTQYIS